MRSLLDYKRLISATLSLLMLLIALGTGSWLTALAALGALLLSLGEVLERLPLRVHVGLAVVGATITGLTCLNPAYENRWDRRTMVMHAALLEVEAGSAAYQVRPAGPSEDEFQLQQTAQDLVNQARYDCGRARDRSATNVAQDFARDRYIPGEATILTDRIETKVDPDACFRRSGEIVDLLPAFRVVFKSVMNRER